MDKTSCFHLAIPFTGDSESTIEFYSALGANIGRKSEDVIIFNFFDHQLVAHRSETLEIPNSIYPRHFGLVLGSEGEFQRILDQANANQLEFYRQPYVRHGGEKTEQRTFFLKDPSSNLLEFKWYKQADAIFSPLANTSIGE